MVPGAGHVPQRASSHGHIYHRKRDSIEAHLTIVFAALAVSRWIEAQTGWSIRKFVKTARRYRTIGIQVGQHTIIAADPIPDDLRQALNAINRVSGDVHYFCPNPTDRKITELSWACGSGPGLLAAIPGERLGEHQLIAGHQLVARLPRNRDQCRRHLACHQADSLRSRNRRPGGCGEHRPGRQAQSRRASRNY